MTATVESKTVDRRMKRGVVEGLSDLSPGARDVSGDVRRELQRLRAAAGEVGYDLSFDQALESAVWVALKDEPEGVQGWWRETFAQTAEVWRSAYLGTPSPLSRFDATVMLDALTSPSGRTQLIA